jgi:hypothetical protein
VLGERVVYAEPPLDACELALRVALEADEEQAGVDLAGGWVDAVVVGSEGIEESRRSFDRLPPSITGTDQGVRRRFRLNDEVDRELRELAESRLARAPDGRPSPTITKS